MVKVLVLRTAGVNCDEETAHAFRLAGGEVSVLHVGSLLRGEERLEEFDVLAIPGGFSYGDDLGAGTVLANQLRTRLAGDLHDFVDEGKLVIGICNGFQVLVRLGILPGWEGDKAASLIENVSGKFEDRWIDLRVETDQCPFLDCKGEHGAPCPRYLRAPVAHREGRFFLRDPDLLERLRDNGQIALTYRQGSGDDDPEPAAAGGAYPANPNGSVLDIAGICNEKGNVLGLMPHPERFVHRLQGPSWTRNPPGASESALETLSSAGDGFSIFSGAVGFVNDRADKIR